MNVYDFDNTIFRGDSTARFYLYCFTHVPALLKRIPGQAVNAAAFGLHIRPKQEFKERMYRFLQDLPDVDALLADFWRENLPRIKSWYKTQQRDDDVIISASPEFLLAPAMEALGIRHMMASRVDKKTGRYTGLNCHGKEKVTRFYEVFPGGQIDEFYSDSLSDTPLAEISAKAFLVKGDERTPWPRG